VSSHRQEESSGLARQPACSYCGERSWIDLGQPEVVLALRHDEEMRAEARRVGMRPVAVRGLLGMGLGALVGFVLVGALWGMGAVAGLMGMAAALSTYQGMQLAQGIDRGLPSRWAMALPPAGEVTAVHRGPAQLRGEPLRAPLTGRPCVAYEVGARIDDQVDAPATTWALLEQALAPLEVDGHPLPAASTHLRLPRHRLGSSTALSLDPAAQAFLQQRGLVIDGLVLELYESIVEADAPVELRRVGDGAELQPVEAGRALPPASAALPPASSALAAAR